MSRASAGPTPTPAICWSASAIEAAFGADLDTALRELVFAPVGVDGVRIAREPADLAAPAFGNPLNYHPGWVYHGLADRPAARRGALDAPR